MYTENTIRRLFFQHTEIVVENDRIGISSEGNSRKIHISMVNTYKRTVLNKMNVNLVYSSPNYSSRKKYSETIVRR